MLRQEVGVGVRSNVMPSLFCLGYCLTAHMHSMGWSVGSKLGGGSGLIHDSSWEMCMTLAIALGV